MDVLLGTDFTVAENRLYRCLDRVLEHTQEMFLWLRQKWADLFKGEFEVLLYDFTRTYFERAREENPKAKYGHSRDKRSHHRWISVGLRKSWTPIPAMALRCVGFWTTSR
jgi:hypothetical protein